MQLHITVYWFNFDDFIYVLIVGKVLILHYDDFIHSYWYNFDSNYWSTVYKHTYGKDLKLKAGYDSEVRLGWASLWVSVFMANYSFLFKNTWICYNIVKG